MTNKDIEEMKRNIDELVEGLKKQEDENARLKATVKSQREKIDSLLKELEGERGKTITIGDGTISMRADMWDIVNENRKLKSENNELRKRLEKLESDICGKSPCVISEFHSFEGESWIRATTYDDVLLRLKKANEKISDLEQKRLNQGLNSLKEIKEMQKLNGELKAENKSLKQQNEYLKSIFESMSMAERPEDVMRKTGLFSEEEIQAHMRANETIRKGMEETVSENDINRNTLIAKLQDQHQQDCIRINDLTTTAHVLAGLCSALRKNVGMD